jgi:hypothetical protein
MKLLLTDHPVAKICTLILAVALWFIIKQRTPTSYSGVVPIHHAD